MYEHWNERLAQERRTTLLKEARQDELYRRAGLRSGSSRAEQALALLILVAPVVLALVRGWLKA